MIPLIVVDGSARAYASAEADLRSASWTLSDDWNARPGVGCSGIVASAEDAAAALLAAVGGAGVLIDARAERDIVDRLCDDLRRLGRGRSSCRRAGAAMSLTREEQSLVEILLAASR